MFYYKVEYWDEIDKKNATDRGLIDSKTYGEAVDDVQKYYGKDITTITLTEFENVLTWDDLCEFIK